MSRRDRRRPSAAPRRPSETPRSKPEPPSSRPPEHRAALVALAVTLGLLVLLRGILPLLPGMSLWSLNLHRFVAPWIGWSLWALAALALLPPFGRRLLPWWEGMGRAIEHRPALAMTVAALFGAALVWMFPDRVRFVGDFLLRQGTVEVAERPSVLFPQALPLDIYLHYTVPSTLAASGWIDANGAARLMGAAEAAALGVLAV